MRRSIALLVTSGLIPIVALGGAFGLVTLQAQRNAVHTGTETAARFGATLAATKLEDGMRAVAMLAKSPAFDGALDERWFRTLGLRLRDDGAAWRTLSVADPSGRRLLDVPTPIGGVAHGRVVDPASLARAVATGQPVVGDVVTGPHGRAAFAIRAPVVRDGRVRYVVSAVVAVDTLRPLLRFRALPPGWRVVIIDGAGNLVASSAPPGALANRLSRQGLAARRSGRPTFYEYERRDGSDAIATWAPIAGTGWTAHVSAPKAPYAGATSSALILLVSVAAACLGLLALLIRLLAQDLKQERAREQAETQRQRMEALGQLTGGVAHDFNNLLTPILGGLDLIRPRVVADAKATRHIDAALASAERARALVARLLAFSRRQALSTSDLNTGELLETLRDLLERSAAPTATVALDVPGALPAVRADRTQLELAILNLVINARDAMPEGGVVRVTAAPLDIDQAPDLAAGRYVAITVTDQGVGMDAETLRQAIDPFFTTKPAEKGTGLGLSMVHGFTAQSGGALRLDSSPSIGTRATIIMPQGSGAATVRRPSQDTSAAAPGRVLLVDDDDRVRTSTAAMLADAGYRVVEARSSREALDRLAGDGRFDAIITDYFMPGATGAELIRDVQRRDPAMPILLVTGFADGAVDIPSNVPKLAKPFRAAELLAQMQRLDRTPALPVTGR